MFYRETFKIRNLLHEIKKQVRLTDVKTIKVEFNTPFHNLHSGTCR